MSLTSTVPAAVPSLFQSSGPFVLKARKKSVPFTFVSPSGPEPPLPGLMSLTSTVPAAVPSLFQSSVPFAGSKPRKKSVPVYIRQPKREGIGAAGGIEVLHEHRSLRRPVALPELEGVRRIIGDEEERPVHGSQVIRVGAAAVGVGDVHEHRPLHRPVALPEPPTVRRIGGGEEECPLHVRQLLRGGVDATGVD